MFLEYRRTRRAIPIQMLTSRLTSYPFYESEAAYRSRWNPNLPSTLLWAEESLMWAYQRIPEKNFSDDPPQEIISILYISFFLFRKLIKEESISKMTAKQPCLCRRIDDAAGRRKARNNGPFLFGNTLSKGMPRRGSCPSGKAIFPASTMENPSKELPKADFCTFLYDDIAHTSTSEM